MATVRSCKLQDESLYDVQSHIWFQEVGDSKEVNFAGAGA